MLENQIYSIESANINQETLNAMKNAGKAMKDIHGNLTIDKVDAIMFVSPSSSPSFYHQPHSIRSVLQLRNFPNHSHIPAFSHLP